MVWVLAGLVLQAAAVVLYFRVERARAVGSAPRLQYERVTEPAIDLQMVRADGTSRPLSDLRGRFVLLHFWATWCPPCREELPALLEAGRELAREGCLEVVAVTLDPDWPAVRAFFGGDVPAEVYRDREGRGSEDLAITTLPETLLLNPDGTPILRFAGAREWRTAAMSDLLRQHCSAASHR
jgi:thiol-disulfide isomerase/thioredoxin